MFDLLATPVHPGKEVHDRILEMNMNMSILFENEEEFAAAKEAGEISFDGYNEYWNLTGIVPEFH